MLKEENLKKEETQPLHVEIPKLLKQQFKTACVTDQKKMVAVVTELLEGYVEDFINRKVRNG